MSASWEFSPTCLPLYSWHIQHRSKLSFCVITRASATERKCLYHGRNLPSPTVSNFPKLPALPLRGASNIPESLLFSSHMPACSLEPHVVGLSTLGFACAPQAWTGQPRKIKPVSTRGPVFSVSYPKLHQVGSLSSLQ